LTAGCTRAAKKIVLAIAIRLLITYLSFNKKKHESH